MECFLWCCLCCFSFVFVCVFYSCDLWMCTVWNRLQSFSDLLNHVFVTNLLVLVQLSALIFFLKYFFTEVLPSLILSPDTKFPMYLRGDPTSYPVSLLICVVTWGWEALFFLHNITFWGQKLLCIHFLCVVRRLILICDFYLKLFYWFDFSSIGWFGGWSCQCSEK